MQCLRPVLMYDTGRKTKNGKRKLSAKRPSRFDGSDYFVYDTAHEVKVPCGKCPACLENKRIAWAVRMQLELFTNPSASFVTLTYDDKHLPKDRLCNKRDVQLFLKRLRQVGRKYGFPFPKIKYFVVAEYGSKKGRPHYHGIFFGVDFKDEIWKPFIATFDEMYHAIWSSPLLAEAWKNGFVSFDNVTGSSIDYVAKYITKQDKDTFRLFSIGIGRDFFVAQDGLTLDATRCALNGFVVLPSRFGFYKVGVPKFLYRYLDRYAPSLLELVKGRTLDYALHFKSSVSSAVREADILTRWTEETKKRKYDNEN